MKLRCNWNSIAQCIVVLVCAFTLKLYYSAASANQLRWILAPTAALVELGSGASFEFESHAGYLSSDRSFLIASSCAGVNFLITAFLMLSMRRLLRDRSKKIAWGFIPTTLMIAYLVTIVANTARITIALRLQKMPAEGGWLSPDQLHRLEGIFVYFGFLLLLFVISEKMESEKTSGLLRQFFFPLVVYYSTMLGIPLANGAWRQGADFWEHSLFVLLVPLLVILPVVACRLYGYRFRH
jgi:exosortase K